jgi:hypothetical protein
VDPLAHDADLVPADDGDVGVGVPEQVRAAVPLLGELHGGADVGQDADAEVRAPDVALGLPHLVGHPQRRAHERGQVLGGEGLQDGRGLAQPHVHEQARAVLDQPAVVQVLDRAHLVVVESRVQAHVGLSNRLSGM